MNDIRNESMLQCPPPPSESNSLTESTGSPERPLSRKGGVDKEDQCEDGMWMCTVCMYCIVATRLSIMYRIFVGGMRVLCARGRVQ